MGCVLQEVKDSSVAVSVKKALRVQVFESLLRHVEEALEYEVDTHRNVTPLTHHAPPHRCNRTDSGPRHGG